ncbi:hypothetical protein P4E94_04325 [Pontiellaceae bacterium B12219]|nr:hypothetical protein [Pontiellaceae bacterium B12219]
MSAKQIFLVTAFFMSAFSAQSERVIVSNATGTLAGQSNRGTSTIVTPVADGADGTVPGGVDLVYEITGLNLNNGSMNADKIVVKFKVSASGAIQTSAELGWLSSPENLMEKDGNWLKVECSEIEIYLDGQLASSSSIIASLSSLSCQLAGWTPGKSAGTINGAFYEASEARQVFESADKKTIFLEYKVTDGAIGAWRFLSMDFTVDLIPDLRTLGLIVS